MSASPPPTTPKRDGRRRRGSTAMRTSLRVPAMMLWLVVLWVALWGSISPANILGGVAVAVGVVVFARLDAATLLPTHFRPQWAIWYVLVFGWKLVESNVRLAYEILTPGNGTHTAILAVPMRGGSDAVVNLVANSITLTPGTMTIEVKTHDHDHLADLADHADRDDLADHADRDDHADHADRDDRAAHDVPVESGDAVPARVTLYVHGMFAADVEAVRHDVLQLEALALRAFGTPEDYARSQRDVIAHEALLTPAQRSAKDAVTDMSDTPSRPGVGRNASAADSRDDSATDSQGDIADDDATPHRGPS